MSLNEKLKIYQEASSKKLDPKHIHILNKYVKRLEDDQRTFGIKPGAKAPNFLWQDNDSSEKEFYDILEQGPVVLTFYRGSWCNYCNIQLEAYEEILSKLDAFGTKLIAVTLENQEDTLRFRDEKHLSFQLMTDKDAEIARSFNLLYSLPEELSEVYKELGVDLEISNDNKHWQLPLTATFIIDKQGLVRHSYVQRDYRTRMEPDSILSILEVIT